MRSQNERREGSDLEMIPLAPRLQVATSQMKKKDVKAEQVKQVVSHLVARFRLDSVDQCVYIVLAREFDRPLAALADQGMTVTGRCQHVAMASIFTMNTANQVQFRQQRQRPVDGHQSQLVV